MDQEQPNTEWRFASSGTSGYVRVLKRTTRVISGERAIPEQNFFALTPFQLPGDVIGAEQATDGTLLRDEYSKRSMGRENTEAV